MHTASMQPDGITCPLRLCGKVYICLMYTVFNRCVTYMPLIDLFRDNIPRHLQKLNKTESKLMETLMAIKSGNAYSLWKKSKLKHYPTVLRTLRKLHEKNFVEILSKDGQHGETTYVSTIRGSFIFYILRNEEQELLTFISSNSRLFHEFYEVKPDKTSIYAIIREFSWSEKSEKVSIDELVKRVVEIHVGDRINNVSYDPEARKDLRTLSRIGWIKSLIIKETQFAIDSRKRDLEALTKFEKEMEKAKE